MGCSPLSRGAIIRLCPLVPAGTIHSLLFVFQHLRGSVSDPGPTLGGTQRCLQQGGAGAKVPSPAAAAPASGQTGASPSSVPPPRCWGWKPRGKREVGTGWVPTSGSVSNARDLKDFIGASHAASGRLAPLLGACVQQGQSRAPRPQMPNSGPRKLRGHFSATGPSFSSPGIRLHPPSRGVQGGLPPSSFPGAGCWQTGR